MDKVLWVVNYNSLNQFLQRAVTAKATAVAIRTDNDIAQAIGPVHNAGLKLYGWRWPSAQTNDATAEANRAAALLAQGMDGYFVDPEGEPGHGELSHHGEDDRRDQRRQVVRGEPDVEPGIADEHRPGRGRRRLDPGRAAESRQAREQYRRAESDVEADPQDPEVIGGVVGGKSDREEDRPRCEEDPGADEEPGDPAREAK